MSEPALWLGFLVACGGWLWATTAPGFSGLPDHQEVAYDNIVVAPTNSATRKQ